MSATSDRVPFVEARFLEDLQAASVALSTPYHEPTIRRVLAAYGDLMYDAAIQVRGSSRPGVPLLFRVLMATPADTLDIATRHGWVHPDDPLASLAASARAHFSSSVIEQPEFAADEGGYDAMFMYLGGLRPLDEVLAVPGMPAGVRAHRERFLALGLDGVTVLHLHYRAKHVSLFFLARGPLGRDALDALVGLVEHDGDDAAAAAAARPPSEAAYRDIIGVLRDSGYYLTVVMDYETGRVVKVELHLLFPVRLPDDMQIPDVGEKLTTFWDMPSYEYEDMDILSYCFGDTRLGDVLALRGYCGGLRSLLRYWDVIGV